MTQLYRCMSITPTSQGVSCKEQWLSPVRINNNNNKKSEDTKITLRHSVSWITFWYSRLVREKKKTGHRETWQNVLKSNGGYRKCNTAGKHRQILSTDTRWGGDMPPPTRALNVNCKSSGQLTQTAEDRRRYSYKRWIYEALVEGRGGKDEQRDTSSKIKLFLGKHGTVEMWKYINANES